MLNFCIRITEQYNKKTKLSLLDWLRRRSSLLANFEPMAASLPFLWRLEAVPLYDSRVTGTDLYPVHTSVSIAFIHSFTRNWYHTLWRKTTWLFQPGPKTFKIHHLVYIRWKITRKRMLKGSLTRDVRLQVYFMNHLSPGPPSIPLGPL